MHMPTISAKVFKSGNSQAIRLPKALRLNAKTVQIEKTARGLFILDPKAEAGRIRALSKLYGSCPEFPDIEQLTMPES
jgi:antitoxin VapB